ncbi:MAG: arginine--tRNA ligase [Rickettsiales bacterium]|nr:MAG: arginine--tRNA ligase [Rickettsiales bacterium]
MNIFKELWHDLVTIGSAICDDKEIWAQGNLEAPKDHLNGDISTNIAMIIAAKNGSNPREISLQLKEHLLKIPYIAHIEVAGPGFINFTIKADKWHECIKSILNDDKDFWQENIGNGYKINVEYVSANPTGPMHVGHARGAVYGDALANVLKLCGYDVTKEYYINDAGSQIDTLLDSAYLRYKEVITGNSVIIPEGLYPGDYIKEVGQKIADKFGNELLNLNKEQINNKIKDLVVDEMMGLIKKDLSELGVHHDVFFSEQSLHNDNKIDNAIKILEQKGLIYTGILPPPKGKIDEEWQEKEQLLFRSTNYGDDQDRPVQKGDGSWTYLAADFAYAKDKIDRGFKTLVYILGADHSGYVKRIQAVINALGDGKVKSDIRISQLVNFVKNNKPIKMSKRSGNFMTVSDVTSHFSKDIIRFMMLTRRNDMTLDFDFDKVKQQSKDNPVFYVQYAHVRTKSIMAKAIETIPLAYEKFINNEFNLSLLSTEEEIQLIKLLASWPKTLTGAAKFCEPQRIAYYLIEVASHFHSIWNLGKENNDYRFNIEEDIELTAARLALVESIRKIIAVGFSVMGVKPIDKM